MFQNFFSLKRGKISAFVAVQQFEPNLIKLESQTKTNGMESQVNEILILG